MKKSSKSKPQSKMQLLPSILRTKHGREIACAIKGMRPLTAREVSGRARYETAEKPFKRTKAQKKIQAKEDKAFARVLFAAMERENEW